MGDDTHALQAALDRGPLDLPAGTYTVTAPLRLGSGAAVRGAGAATGKKLIG